MPYIETSLKLESVPVGESRFLEIGDIQVGLFRSADGLFAIDNICPHRGAPLHDGFVADGVVTCPWHQWQFQLDDGVCRNIPNVRIITYPVEVRDGVIWIDLKDQGAAKT
ncbi:MAG: nitrite reductase small subunit NirD [Methylacidiphilales bacterium]|nr:nitrite reductase small subunit NirD [Candidatus Methylacidiphilales bacterium]